MTRALAVALALALAELLGGCSQEHREQQPEQQQTQQLSPAVKAALIAAIGPHVSDADVTEFLRSAKLASRTPRDNEVTARLDEAVSLLRSAAQDDYQAAKHRKDATNAQTAADWNNRMNTEGNSEQICDETTDHDMQQHCKEGRQLVVTQRTEAKLKTEAAQSYEDKSRREKEQAADLIQKLRLELN
jgi:hypothetical protein